MNGFVKVTNTWADLSTLEITDIDGVTSQVELLGGSTYDLTVTGNIPYGKPTLLVWEGELTTGVEEEAAKALMQGQQGIYTVGVNPFYVRSSSGDIILQIRKIS